MYSKIEKELNKWCNCKIYNIVDSVSQIEASGL